MLNVCAKFHENGTCALQEITTGVTNERTNETTNQQTVVITLLRVVSVINSKLGQQRVAVEPWNSQFISIRQVSSDAVTLHARVLLYNSTVAYGSLLLAAALAMQFTD